MNQIVVRGLLWLAFLLTMLGQKRYLDFIAAWQVWLILASIIAIAIATAAAAAHRDQSCTHEGHDHGPGEHGTWRGTLLHAIPLWAAFALGPQAGLGSHAVVTSGLWLPTGEPPPLVLPDFLPSFHASAVRSDSPVAPDRWTDTSVPKNLDLHRLYQPGAFLGVEKVVVIGKVMPGVDASLAKPEFMPTGTALTEVHCTVYRFVMTCCAADARPAQVLVCGEPPPAELTSQTWVEIKGVWLKPNAGGLAGIVAERWQVVEAPANEYLAPY